MYRLSLGLWTIDGYTRKGFWDPRKEKVIGDFLTEDAAWEAWKKHVTERQEEVYALINDGFAQHVAYRPRQWRGPSQAG